MTKRIALGLVAASLAVGMFPGTASAGQYCERADDAAVAAGDACRAALGTVLGACSRVGEKLGGGGCGLG